MCKKKDLLGIPPPNKLNGAGPPPLEGGGPPPPEDGGDGLDPAVAKDFDGNDGTPPGNIPPPPPPPPLVGSK